MGNKKQTVQKTTKKTVFEVFGREGYDVSKFIAGLLIPSMICSCRKAPNGERAKILARLKTEKKPFLFFDNKPPEEAGHNEDRTKIPDYERPPLEETNLGSIWTLCKKQWEHWYVNINLCIFLHKCSSAKAISKMFKVQ
ncbi:hypothetical protein [Candidatus Endomicrobiellum agilis]|uniref:hypothetical protein n=1 Tax=Candidatus Endomicrobiellum agilis TaxID=3238957 RepID=UPI003579B02B|nr:hypothetical protein [Endomicrobium sp.]